MYNKVILVGNLTRDVDLKFTQSGKAVANFGIATNRKYGEDKQETFFGEVTAWGKMAETASEYIHKGSKVLIEGRLTTEQWADSDGAKRSKTRIVAENIRFLSAKGDVAKQDGYDDVNEDKGGLEPF